MQIEMFPIKDIKGNPNNPRIIKDKQFNKLVNSIKDFPEMLRIRPIVVDENMIVLGGNMRLKACNDAGLFEVPIIRADNLTEEQKQEFIIKDNNSFGEWNFDDLGNNWDMEKLDEWGLNTYQAEGFEDDVEEEEKENIYTAKIDIPTYEIKGKKPTIKEMIDDSKTKKLIKEIEEKKLPKEIEEFLKLSASRHTIFNFEKIAEYYAHAEKDTQELMEKSALVLIDFEKAIEEGYVNMTEEMLSLIKK